MRNNAPRIIGSALAAALLAAAAGLPAGRVSAAPPTITVTVVDSATGAPMAARCRIIDQYNSNRYPSLSLFHTGNGGYFYTEGVFSLYVPYGRVILHAGNGFEYRERVDTLELAYDSGTNFTLTLARGVSMAERRWFPGDSHVHINHATGSYALTPTDACFMGRAEGLLAVNCLDNDYFFTGATTPCGTSDCVVSMSEEWRCSPWGHVGFLDVSALVEPVGSTWWPLAMDAVDSCRLAAGGVAVWAHPVTTGDFDEVDAWPGSGLARELPVDAIGGRFDAFDVMSYSNELHGGIELDLWYRLLNCGFRIPASAGTDAVMNHVESLPLGGYRVYARLPGTDFDFQEWLESLAAGRTFVTNGPLITEFSVEGLEPGEAAELAPPTPSVSGSISVRSMYPVASVEIVMNGDVAKTIQIDPPRGSIDTSFSVGISGSAWIAARVTGPDIGWLTIGSQLFAHTSPVYLTVWDEPVVVAEDASYFVQWIAALEAIADTADSWPYPEARVRALAELAAAREYYENLASDALTGVDEGGQGVPPPSPVVNAPNPFGSLTAIEFDVPASTAGEAAVSVTIYDVAGRLVRRLLDGRLPTGRHGVTWDCRDDRGAELSSGVYFARVVSGRAAAQRKLVVIR